MRELNHGSVEVGLEPVQVCVAGQDCSSVTIQNVSDADVFVGGRTVAADGAHRGILVKSGESQSISVFPHDATPIYAVTVGKNDNDEDATATVVFMTD